MSSPKHSLQRYIIKYQAVQAFLILFHCIRYRMSLLNPLAQIIAVACVACKRIFGRCYTCLHSLPVWAFVLWLCVCTRVSSSVHVSTCAWLRTHDVASSLETLLDTRESKKLRKWAQLILEKPKIFLCYVLTSLLLLLLSRYTHSLHKRDNQHAPQTFLHHWRIGCMRITGNASLLRRNWTSWKTFWN